MIGSVSVGAFSFVTEASATKHLFIDRQCIIADTIIDYLILAKVSAVMYIVIVGMFFVFVLPSKRQNDSEKLAAPFMGVGILSLVFDFCFMFAFFIQIVEVRKRAKVIFGSTYPNNAIGYGQIMAMGFCVQTFVQVLATWHSKLL